MSHDDKIAIFPASGGISGGTYRHLADLIDARRLILVSRHPEKIDPKYAAGGAAVRRGDYERAEALEGAFAGARVLSLVSHASVSHRRRFGLHKAAIDAAVRAGVTHVFYSSLGFAGARDRPDHTVAHVMKAHLDTERYLASLAAESDGKFTYTIVRQGLYTESFPLYLAFLDVARPPAQLPAEVRIPHPGTGPGIAWVKRDELGEATARLIARYTSPSSSSPEHDEPAERQRQRYRNATLLLSGPREISLGESAAIIGRVAGRSGGDIEVREVSVDEWAAQDCVRGVSPYLTVADGMDRAWATSWATSWDALREGEGAAVTGHLRELLGREPEAFETTVAAMVRAARQKEEGEVVA
ncbi:uncharacterized protein BKCO1_540008 [Diplodia corticola]|uniref:NAD(P)-binding domain-containing protein n=1 Tax=Diplodia corticola TaxID=236234 RepID=A0A1J9QR48_9PEZI|nr:uncharacterized protein BKCO1_540008 [Diplodia corticola]OJD30889.1 hypothetical protein BKCO1_540008 [Diplodia corticola]